MAENAFKLLGKFDRVAAVSLAQKERTSRRIWKYQHPARNDLRYQGDLISRFDATLAANIPGRPRLTPLLNETGMNSGGPILGRAETKFVRSIWVEMRTKVKRSTTPSRPLWATWAVQPSTSLAEHH